MSSELLSLSGHPTCKRPFSSPGPNINKTKYKYERDHQQIQNSYKNILIKHSQLDWRLPALPGPNINKTTNIHEL